MDVTSPTIACPDCGKEIPLTETIAAPLIAQLKEENEGKLRLALDQKKEAERKLAEQREALEKEKESFDEEVAKKVAAKAAESEKAQRARIREELETEIKGAKEREEEVVGRLKKSQEQVEELLKANRKAELDAQAAKLDRKSVV